MQLSQLGTAKTISIDKAPATKRVFVEELMGTDRAAKRRGSISNIGWRFRGICVWKNLCTGIKKGIDIVDFERYMIAHATSI